MFRENPPRQVISISPTYNYGAVRPAQPFVDPTSGYSMLLKSNTCNSELLHFAALSSFNIFSYNHIIFRTTNLAAEYVTFEMMISETLVGGLIGRCGSNISRIRNESGAMIKVGRSLIVKLSYIWLLLILLLIHLFFLAFLICFFDLPSFQVYGGKGEQKHRHIQFGGSAQQVNPLFSFV